MSLMSTAHQAGIRRLAAVVITLWHLPRHLMWILEELESQAIDREGEQLWVASSRLRVLMLAVPVITWRSVWLASAWKRFPTIEGRYGQLTRGKRCCRHFSNRFQEELNLILHRLYRAWWTLRLNSWVNWVLLESVWVNKQIFCLPKIAQTDTKWTLTKPAEIRLCKWLFRFMTSFCCFFFRCWSSPSLWRHTPTLAQMNVVLHFDPWRCDAKWYLSQLHIIYIISN